MQIIYRLSDDMKPRIQFVIIVGLVILLLGIVWYPFPEKNRTITQTFPATIQRDCAPWDGSAFTVKILLQGQGSDTINISIWQAPELKFPKTFSFPEETGQLGNVSLLHSNGSAEQLTGNVFFSSVKQGNPAEGRFDLFSGTGQRFTGELHAEWHDQIVFCG